MPVLQTFQSPKLGIWKIDESWEEMLNLLKNKDLYIPYISKLKSNSRKQEWLAVRLLLKHLTNKEMQIEYHENGAPYLPDSSVNISISHTKGFAAVILNDKKPTGIDIEYRSERVLKLITKFLGKEELNIIEKSDRPLETAIICWCAKETAFKMISEENTDFIKHLQIMPFDFAEKGTLKLKEYKTMQEQLFKIDFVVSKDYILTYIN